MEVFRPAPETTREPVDRCYDIGLENPPGEVKTELQEMSCTAVVGRTCHPKRHHLRHPSETGTVTVACGVARLSRTTRRA